MNAYTVAQALHPLGCTCEGDTMPGTGDCDWCWAAREWAQHVCKCGQIRFQAQANPNECITCMVYTEAERRESNERQREFAQNTRGAR